MVKSRSQVGPAPAARCGGLAGGLAALTLVGAPLVAGAAPAIALHSTPPIAILTRSDMQDAGLMFPDSSMTFLRDQDGSYRVFGAGGSVAGLGDGRTTTPFGGYQFVGSLDRLAPVRGADGRPALALANGRAQASPDGSDFDRDYGGGGPTYSIDGAGKLVQLYHGEHRCDPALGLPAYGGTGLAISTDGGRSFRKLGQILSPGVQREAFCESGKTGGFWTDGGMIEADAGGRRAAGADTYEYILFVDHNSTHEPFIGVSIARAAKREVLTAIASERAPRFWKYYNPTGAPGPRDRFFTEPGVGGRSTPIVVADRTFIGSPLVSFNAHVGQFVLSYQYNQKHIALRFSDDLWAWSDPHDIVGIDETDERRLFYPSIAGLEEDPAVLGRRFYVYFLERRPRNTDPELLRSTVEVDLAGAGR